MASVYSGSITVGTATREQIGTLHNHPSRIFIHEDSGSDKIFIGNSSVTAANGFHLEQNVYLEIDLPPNEGLYCIATSDAQILTWLQVKV